MTHPRDPLRRCRPRLVPLTAIVCLRIAFEGIDLVAVLSAPSAAPSGVGVVVIVGGPQYRVGSHRQFVELARALVRAGHHVLRYDCRGMGDSDGAMQGFEASVPDVGAAIDALLQGGARGAASRLVGPVRCGFNRTDVRCTAARRDGAGAGQPVGPRRRQSGDRDRQAVLPWPPVASGVLAQAAERPLRLGLVAALTGCESACDVRPARGRDSRTRQLSSQHGARAGEVSTDRSCFC